MNTVFWPRRLGIRKVRARGRGLERGAGFSKRRKFVLVAVVLSLYLFVVQNLAVEVRLGAIVLLAGLTYALSAWSLYKDLRGVAWMTNLILPTMYPVAVALFYFLLPQATLTRSVVTIVFAVSMYGLLLTANIFAVASIRTIQLLRAARTVGFLLSVVTAALLFQVIFTLKLPGYLIALATLAAAWPILLQGIWSYTLTERLGRDELWTSLVGTVVMVEVAVVLSFWLIEAPFASILLAMIVYVLLGIFQHQLEKRLFARTAQEYLSFAALVLVIVTVSVLTRWAG